MILYYLHEISWKRWLKTLFISGGIGALIVSFFLNKYFVTNKAPMANIVFSASNAVPNQNVAFDGATSTDPEGKKLNFEWLINGKVITSQSFFNYAFTNVGTQHVQLNVRDEQGLLGSDSVFVNIITPKTVNSLQDALMFFHYNIGWSSNIRGRVEYYKINSISFEGKYYVNMNYDYGNRGENHLIISEHKRKIFGIWKDVDGMGELELIFNQNYSEATGWWKYDNSDTKYELRLKRISDE